MSLCRNVVPLAGDPAAAGLFENVGNLAAGNVRLRLQGHFECRDVGRPLYRFDILDVRINAVVGDITFMPEPDASVVGAIGHSGGGLEPQARGDGLYGQALQALAPLARRHGLAEFVVAIPLTNQPAMRVAEKLALRALPAMEGRMRFAVPSGERALVR